MTNRILLEPPANMGRLFQVPPYRERFTKMLTDAVITSGRVRRPHERLDLLDLRAILSHNRLVCFYVQNFTYELCVDANLVGLDYLTLQHQWKFGNIWSVHHVAFHRSESSCNKFVGILPGGYTDEISLLHVILRGNAYRKGFLLHEIAVSVGGLAN